MLKKCLLLIPLFALLCFSCKKQVNHNATFTISASLKNSNSVSINWAAVTLSEYKNVTIYRSTSPIQDPTFEKAIDGNLIIATITDNTVTNFLDSNITIGTSGVVYYKAVLNLSNRFIVSEQVQISLNGFSLVLPNGQFSGNFLVKRLPEINALYVININQSSISMIDYTQKKLMATVSYFTNTNPMACAVIDNGKPELFLYENNSITCYDGINLIQKYSINVPSGYYVIDFKVKNGFLYLLNSSNTITTYDLSNQNIVNQLTIPSSTTIYNPDIFTGSQSNLLFIKYNTQYQFYQTSTGVYTSYYKNSVVTYNLINGMPTSGTMLNIAALNGDTTNSNNTSSANYIQVSPDGKYITCNQNGDVYEMSNNSTHNIRSVNNFNPLPVYSNDGKYILGKNVFNSSIISPNLMDVFSLPAFNAVTSLKTQNSGFPLIADDFLDSDTLVSYNVAQTFINNQTSNTLTVLFKKVD